MFINCCRLQIKENECLGLETELLFSVLLSGKGRIKTAEMPVLVGIASIFV